MEHSAEALILTDLGSGDKVLFYVNPKNISFDFSHHITTNMTRGGKTVSGAQTTDVGGWAVQHWGMTLPKITANCSTGGFFIPIDGYTNYNREYSEAYKNLVKIKEMFDNNGYEFHKVQGVNRINKVGLVRLSYGGFISSKSHYNQDYVGRFDSFQITENADNPFTLSFTFNFTALRRYDAAMMSHVYGHVVVPGANKRQQNEPTRPAFLPSVTVHPEQRGLPGTFQGEPIAPNNPIPSA